MKEILQDPAKLEELIKEREKLPTKAVKKFVSPVSSRQSERLRNRERVDQMDYAGESGFTSSLADISENHIREPWIFVP